MATGTQNNDPKLIILENYLKEAQISSKFKQKKKAEMGVSANYEEKYARLDKSLHSENKYTSTIPSRPNLHKQKDVGMSNNQRFLKFIVSDKSKWLREHYPNAFLLLCLIAERARRETNKPDGLWVGDVILARDEASKACGITVDQFRTALSKLEENNIVKIIKTHKKPIKRQNFPIKIPIKGMLINLCDSSIWDINSEDDPHRNPHAIPIESPCDPHKQERKRMKKNEKESSSPKPPSSKKSDRLIDDSSSKKEIFFTHREANLSREEWDAGMQKWGTVTKLKAVIDEILDWPKRKNEITDWKKVLNNWCSKVKDNDHVQKNEKICEILEKKFEKANHGWKPRRYVDRMKDDVGLLFESLASANPNPAFFSFYKKTFEVEVSEFMTSKNLKPLSFYIK